MTVSDEDGGRGRGIAPQPGNPAGGENAKPAGSDTTQPADGSVKPAEGSSDTPGAAETAGTETGELAPDERAELEELRSDERAELERLRAEVADLQSQPGGPEGAAAPGRRRRGRWRAPVAVVLIVLGCILAPLSVVAVWTANQVSDTNRYIANIEPLVHEPAVQNALTDRVTTEITSRLNVEGLATAAGAELTQRGLTRIGSLLDNFSGSLASAVNGFVHTQVHRIVTGPRFANLWVQVNRTVHAQLVKALSGQGNGAITISNNQVVLNLGPFIDLVKRDLAGKGLTIINKIPSVNPTLALFSAKYLVKAQSGYRLLNNLKIVLPILTLVLIGAGVYVARSHRRALIGAGLGFAVSMVILGLGLTIFRGIYLGSVPSSVLPADAAAVLYDTLVRFIRDGLRVLLVVGLIVAIAAFFSGPSVTAVRARGAVKSGFNWLRARGERAGVSTGPVGQWTYAHRRALRIAAVAIAALVFVFWGQPTWVTALVIAIVLLLVLGLIELIGRPPAQPQVAEQPG